MEHWERPPDRSIVETAFAMRASTQPPKGNVGITTIRAVVAGVSERPIFDAVEHWWECEPGETERDFVAMAFGEARALGIAAVRFEGLAAVPPEGPPR